MSYCAKWKFTHPTQEYESFIHAAADACFQSERHVVQNLTFYLECTPNGFSPQGMTEGTCVLWLAIVQNIIGANVKCKIICEAVGYEAEGSWNKLGVNVYSFAVGPPFISFQTLKQKKSFQFECHIDIIDIIYKNILVAPNNIVSANTISWKFSDQLVTKFHNAAQNADIPSDLFSISGCTFGLECTPNGYASKVPISYCGLFVALRALPSNVKALQSVQMSASCPEVNYQSSVTVNAWTVPPNNYISIDFPIYIDNNKFKNLSQWTFHCNINIGSFIYNNSINAVDLQQNQTKRVVLSNKTVNRMNSNTFIMKFDNASECQLCQNAKRGDIIRSERIMVQGCRFYLDITPNGWKNSVNGNLSWLVLQELPTHINAHSVLIHFKVTCNCTGINFKEERNAVLKPENSNETNALYSITTYKGIEFELFKSLSEWEVQYEIIVLEFRDENDYIIDMEEKKEDPNNQETKPIINETKEDSPVQNDIVIERLLKTNDEKERENLKFNYKRKS